MGFLRKLFSASQSNKTENEEFSTNTEPDALEWRNRYLTTRVEHLSQKLKKSGRTTPNFQPLPDDLEARNAALEEQVKRLEDMS